MYDEPAYTFGYSLGLCGCTKVIGGYEGMWLFFFCKEMLL